MGYPVSGTLGSGARTTIHQVTDRHGRTRALKHLVLRSERDRRCLEQMRHEHRLARRLDFPGLRRTHRLHLRRAPFRVVEAGLLMDLVEGEPLASAPTGETLPVIESFRQVGEALACLHRLGWVHADVKPTNIIVSSDGAVLIDLGQAARIGASKDRVQGTPGFLAPEQALRRPLTPGTDLHGFGAALYWVLTGRTIPTVIGSDGATDEHPSPPVPIAELRDDVPTGLIELVDRCIAPRVASRPSGMNEVLGILSVLRKERIRESHD